MNLSQIHTQCKLILCVIFLSAFNTPNIKHHNTFIRSDHLIYDQTSQIIETKNHTDLIIPPYIFNSQNTLYDTTLNQLWLNDVTIYAPQNRRINSQAAFYDANNNYMKMSKIAADLGDNNLVVATQAVSFNEQHLELHGASFTPCKMCGRKNPIWSISAQKTILDEEKKQITYNHAKFRIYGIPIFYTPYFSHPRPNAPARSGFLIPSFKDNTFNAPYYWRIRPNIDATIQPRLTTDAIIYQGQFRHLLQDGEYTINASYGQVPINTVHSTNNLPNKKGKHSGFYIQSTANFYNNINYGADINLVSDKPFLKKYYNKFDSFLTSKLFLQHSKEDEYINIEALYFQNLFDDEQALGRHSLVTPEIYYKKFWQPFNNSNHTVILDNHFMNYHAREKIDLLKNSVSVTWRNTNILPGGNLLTVSAYNKLDLYLRHINAPYRPDHNNYHTALSRNIPEAQIDLRNTFIVDNMQGILIEPRIMMVVGKKQQNQYSKFRTIGHEYFEVLESNLYTNSRSAISDFHDFGTRVNYGITAYIPGKFATLRSFLGETYYAHMPNTKYRNQLVGSTTILLPRQNIYFTHKFNKLKSHYQSLRDEISTGFNSKYFDASIGYFEQRPMQQILDEYNLLKIKQSNISTTVHITPQLDFTNNFRVDFAARNKARLLLHTMKVTYLMDCVSIHAKLTNDRMLDKARGIKKSHDIALTVGLKTINM